MQVSVESEERATTNFGLSSRRLVRGITLKR